MKTLKIVGFVSAVLGIARMFPLLMFLFRPISYSNREILFQLGYWAMQALLVVAGLKMAAGKRWALYVGVLLALLDALYYVVRGVSVDPLDPILFVVYVIALATYQPPRTSSARSQRMAL